jgi:hypothetical protein
MTRYANIYCDGFFNNEIFSSESPRNRDNCLLPWRQLKNDLLRLDIELNTPDVNQAKQHEVFVDLYVDGQNVTNNAHKKILVAIENPAINPLNKNLDYLKQFDHVFSWNSWALSLNNATKIHFPTDIFLKTSSFNNHANRKIFSCMINANKLLPVKDNNDLYRERIKIIRWFEKMQPADFSLFGRGWNKPSPAFNYKEKVFRRLSRILSQTFNKRPFPSWRGEVENKFYILSNSKFTFCYENSKNLENYVTEKIIDCFIAGTIPIYFGASNIEELIPQGCFIDARKYSDVADIYKSIKSLNLQDLDKFQNSILDFMRSDEIKKFGPNYFSKHICQVFETL